MRLVGIRRDRRVWIGVDVDGAVSPIAEVDDFYADVRRSSGSGARDHPRGDAGLARSSSRRRCRPRRG